MCGGREACDAGRGQPRVPPMLLVDWLEGVPCKFLIQERLMKATPPLAPIDTNTCARHGIGNWDPTTPCL
ncbi:hypothetical protein PR202_ga04567 [Eleusine coracana subsp. coracana]|uniref:Uncharacterized protein n=1 Tax=Eleusine coracana subsp. coracana TaxID=191504 RepID=A0AAV5BRB1_ELECO|nr:hypothetical protein PR202_ga04567 [Eleusine coracana subsp. coracana]